jgi:hypothetical protein
MGLAVYTLVVVDTKPVGASFSRMACPGSQVLFITILDTVFVQPTDFVVRFNPNIVCNP